MELFHISMSGSFNFKVHVQFGKLHTPREHRLLFPRPGKSKSAMDKANPPFGKQKHQRGLRPTPGEQDV
jgi:hypothetical protein